MQHRFLAQAESKRPLQILTWRRLDRSDAREMIAFPRDDASPAVTTARDASVGSSQLVGQFEQEDGCYRWRLSEVVFCHTLMVPGTYDYNPISAKVDSMCRFC